MFHANEAHKGNGKLTVKNGEMVFHVSLPSKNTIGLYKGLADDAKANETKWLKPTTDKVTYEDGSVEEVFGFDIPVDEINSEFDLALVGKKGVWYDHKVKVEFPSKTDSANYKAEVSLIGGTGKAKIISAVINSKNGKSFAKIEWSSKNYDYMIVDGKKYSDLNTSKNSVFQFEVKDISKPVDVIANTTAMSKPHEIEYKLKFKIIE